MHAYLSALHPPTPSLSLSSLFFRFAYTCSGLQTVCLKKKKKKEHLYLQFFLLISRLAPRRSNTKALSTVLILQPGRLLTWFMQCCLNSCLEITLYSAHWEAASRPASHCHSKVLADSELSVKEMRLIGKRPVQLISPAGEFLHTVPVVCVCVCAWMQIRSTLWENDRGAPTVWGKVGTAFYFEYKNIVEQEQMIAELAPLKARCAAPPAARTHTWRSSFLPGQQTHAASHSWRRRGQMTTFSTVALMIFTRTHS